MTSDAESKSKYTYRYVCASGRHADECAFLCYRFLTERGFDYDYLDSWVCISTPETMQAVYGVRGWLTGVWRSDAGAIYASDADGGSIHSLADSTSAGDEGAPWQELPLGAALLGVWGLDEAHVYTWGGVIKASRVFCFDGKRWNALPDIDGEVLSIRGCAPDCLYAVGHEGLVTRFDGKAWHRITLPTTESLTGVWLESPDEVYICGQAGTLFEGSQDGFIERAVWEGPLQDVAKWKGQVWVGGNDSGLLRLDGTTNKLDVIKPNINADRFDARIDLLMAMGDRVAYTIDGLKFKGDGLGAVERILDADPPMFQEP